jgi:hypothetical protein
MIDEPTAGHPEPDWPVHAPYVAAGIVVVEYVAQQRADLMDVGDLGDVGVRR